MKTESVQSAIPLWKTNLLLFECSLYTTARQKYIPKYYFTHPSYDNFKELMSKQNPILLLNICKFVVFALKLRDTYLTTNVQTL